MMCVLRVALGHADRCVWLIPALAIVALYAIEPFNFTALVLGLIEDCVLVPQVLRLLVLGLRCAARRGVAVMPDRVGVNAAMTRAMK
ncbi:hypothetical protein BDI4_210008 [Burkholderia diffusa]|nr:hypothetical protein BDI4_210008 [Burkholderia diffusa]